MESRPPIVEGERLIYAPRTNASLGCNTTLMQALTLPLCALILAMWENMKLQAASIAFLQRVIM